MMDLRIGWGAREGEKLRGKVRKWGGGITEVELPNHSRRQNAEEILKWGTLTFLGNMIE